MEATMKKSAVLVLLALALFAGLAGAQGKTYQLRTSTNLAGTGTIGKGLAYFVDLVNKQSAGRDQATANIRRRVGSQSRAGGDVQNRIPGNGSVPPPNRSRHLGSPFMMFEFPYLFKDNAHYRRVLKAWRPNVSRLTKP
jgi:TRAP-type C4-dicarboxylate transport system substrate-binding protein